MLSKITQQIQENGYQFIILSLPAFKRLYKELMDDDMGRRTPNELSLSGCTILPTSVPGIAIAIPTTYNCRGGRVHDLEIK